MQKEPFKNKQNSHSKVFDIFECLNQIYDKFHPTTQKKNLSLQLTYGQIPIALIGDHGSIKQILTTFLDNAIKFTKKGSITLSADVENTTETEITIKFSVTDTGIGIPKEQQANVFKTFEQISKASTAIPTEVDLFTAKYLVESMKGKIGFDSEENKGSTFWFTATLTIASIEETSSIIFKDKVTTLPKFNVSVLLAEDSKMSRFIASNTLKKLGCNVDTVENGQQAVDKSLNNNYDIIFMDLLMPIMDGLEATKVIRQKESSNKNIIIALTGGISENDKEECEKAGMDDLLYKPIVIENLIHIFDNFTPELKTKETDYKENNDVISWSNKFSVGIPSIDNQHKNLFKYTNMLHNAIMQKRNKYIVDQILENLLIYTDTHFAHEEQYFKKFNYEHTEEHCKQHNDLKNQLKEFVDKHKKGEEDITEDLFKFLKTWITEHLATEDAQYIDCFKEHGL
ncbi:MAG: bacteriohemerythrin [Proteobacteria bacterium]|nr:bacteriohemerythrin [Pseudomonadota bacterium]